jgi:hypothetical protein
MKRTMERMKNITKATPKKAVCITSFMGMMILYCAGLGNPDSGGYTG